MNVLGGGRNKRGKKVKCLYSPRDKTRNKAGGYKEGPGWCQTYKEKYQKDKSLNQISGSALRFIDGLSYHRYGALLKRAQVGGSLKGLRKYTTGKPYY